MPEVEGNVQVLSPGEQEEAVNYGLAAGQETQAFTEAMEAAVSAEGYEGKKEQAQKLKELLVKQPVWISNIAMRLKAQAREVLTSTEKATSDQENLIKTKDAMQKELDELRTEGCVARVEKLRAKLEEVQEERRAYVEKVEDAEKEGRKPYSNTGKGTRYVAFLTQRADLMTRAEMSKKRNQEHVTLGFPKGDLEGLVSEIHNDEEQLQKWRMQSDRLTDLAESLKSDGWPPECHLEQLDEALTEAAEALDTWKGHLHPEVQRRQDLQKKMETLFKEQLSLLTWCTTQQQALQQLTKQEDIVEFCTSLHELVPTMLENMTLVQDMSEPHLPNSLVTNSSVDLHNAWVKLQVTSYEMLLKTLMEQHAESGLKEAVVSFQEWQRENVKPVLDEVDELLQCPEQKDMVANASDMCKELQHEFQPHLILMDHLTDFEVRMEVIEDQYHPMLKTVLSSLTALSQRIRLGNQATFKGKADYETRINDLNDYIAARDTDTTAWEYAKERASNIQKLIPRIETP
eukprot:TRINITY_DN8157_c0_g1_i1.p2 TRINITY_DN8157_c0_g1~~TRINITY_DN8157_c0_g1_i1.p2  ORF type:complete len:538 (+),score=294.15 TRINITY_DN8157_c0_g1_i1:68-1615(+)